MIRLTIFDYENLLNMNLKTIKTPKSEHTIIEPYIIRMSVKENELIDSKDIEDSYEAHIALTTIGGYAILTDATNSFNITADARETLSKKKFIASALVVKNSASRLVGNFFIRFNNPITPTKVFNNEEKALEWLRLMVKKHFSEN